MANEYIEISEKTLDDCITSACRKLSITSDNLDYEVIDQGSLGFMGFNSRNAVIRAKVKENEHGSAAAGGDVLGNVHEEKTQEEYETDRRKEKESASGRDFGKSDFTRSSYGSGRGFYGSRSGGRRNGYASSYDRPKKDFTQTSIYDHAPATSRRAEEPKIDYTDEQIEEFQKKAENFLAPMFQTMGMDVRVSYDFDKEENILNVDFEGDDMGILIGKRGQTLDSIQYLVSLVVNKDVEGYVHVKADTEDYRARRRKTLENLAKNIAFKVKKTHKAQALEPMNPYERRIIHSALQGDRYVTTYSEGEDPYRRVVITPKR